MKFHHWSMHFQKRVLHGGAPKEKLAIRAREGPGVGRFSRRANYEVSTTLTGKVPLCCVFFNEQTFRKEKSLKKEAT